MEGAGVQYGLRERWRTLECGCFRLSSDRHPTPPLAAPVSGAKCREQPTTGVHSEATVALPTLPSCSHCQQHALRLLCFIVLSTSTQSPISLPITPRSQNNCLRYACYQAKVTSGHSMLHHRPFSHSPAPTLSSSFVLDDVCPANTMERLYHDARAHPAMASHYARHRLRCIGLKMRQMYTYCEYTIIRT